MVIMKITIPLKKLNVMNVEILCKNGSEMMQILGVGDPPPLDVYPTSYLWILPS